MNPVIQRADTKTRATHMSWDKEVVSKPRFRNVVTLDVNLAVDAWGDLSEYTPGVEFRELPVRLHRAFVKSLGKFGAKKL